MDTIASILKKWYSPLYHFFLADKMDGPSGGQEAAPLVFLPRQHSGAWNAPLMFPHTAKTVPTCWRNFLRLYTDTVFLRLHTDTDMRLYSDAVFFVPT
jgi:hypothetical protein